MYLRHLLQARDSQAVAKSCLLDLEVREVALVAGLIEAELKAHDGEVGEITNFWHAEELLPDEDRVFLHGLRQCVTMGEPPISHLEYVTVFSPVCEGTSVREIVQQGGSHPSLACTVTS